MAAAIAAEQTRDASGQHERAKLARGPQQPMPEAPSPAAEVPLNVLAAMAARNGRGGR